MKVKMCIITCVFVAGWLLCAIAHHSLGGDILLSLMITFFTCAYHFLMRFAVGGIINAIFRNRMDYTRRWFAQKPFEPKLYKALGVKKWKNNMPTYSPETFSLEHHTLEEIVSATCQSEVVHEIIALLSLVPIAFTAIWGTFPVFLLTSIAAMLLDLSFVVMQRYNRPRLLRLMKHQKGDEKKNAS